MGIGRQCGWTPSSSPLRDRAPPWTPWRAGGRRRMVTPCHGGICMVQGTRSACAVHAHAPTASSCVCAGGAAWYMHCTPARHSFASTHGRWPARWWSSCPPVPRQPPRPRRLPRLQRPLRLARTCRRAAHRARGSEPGGGACPLPRSATRRAAGRPAPKCPEEEPLWWRAVAPCRSESARMEGQPGTPRQSARSSRRSAYLGPSEPLPQSAARH